MPTEILMPALSPTMEEGTLSRWLKSEGDEVAPGDVIAEIETDKATMEVEAVDEGRLGRILVPEGTEGVKVNAVIALLLEEGEDPAAVERAQAGGTGNRADSAPAPAGNGAGAAPAATPSTAAPSPAPPARGQNGQRIFASPLARRIAAERGIDLAALTGSGPHGRIVKADVETAGPAARAQAPAAPAAPAEPAAPGPYAGPEPAGPSGFDAIAKIYADRETEEISLDGMRRTIAARLSEAKRTIPHFYLRRDIDLGALLGTRAQMNARGEARGVKLSVNDFVIKACALALQDHPDCNAVWAGDRILRLKPSDIAVAVAVEGGLFTPVLRDAETRSLSALSSEMKALAARARERRLAPSDYAGGSFAVSNLGMYGIDNFDAVINPPHAAILAVGAGVEKPVVRDGALAVATVMSVTLSVDHRVIDGAMGARLLDTIRGYLEDPLSMLM